MAGVWPPEVYNCVAYGLWIHLLLDQSPQCFSNCVWRF